MNISTIKTVIFDMDGVIIDSQSIWHEIEPELFKELFPDSDQADRERFAHRITGMSIQDAFHVLKEEEGLKVSWDHFFAIYDTNSRQVYSELVSLSPLLAELLDLLQDRYKLGLASGAFRSWIEIVVNRFGLAGYFTALVAAEEIEGSGKPAPDIFLHTARLLHTEPEACLVIEDSAAGVQAAKAARMSCIGYLGHANRQDLSQADMTVHDFSEIIALIEQLDRRIDKVNISS